VENCRRTIERLQIARTSARRISEQSQKVCARARWTIDAMIGKPIPRGHHPTLTDAALRRLASQAAARRAAAAAAARRAGNADR
jgi:hypothetical protein